MPEDTRALRRKYEEAAAYIQARVAATPDAAIILGSGLNQLEQGVAESVTLAYRDIPHFPIPHVEGHRGRLVVGRLGSKLVAMLVGRAHYYEGHTMKEITLPLRAMQALGVRKLIVTNAAGGLNPAFNVGDLMVISDHINLVGIAGHNPLFGPNDPHLGPRFPDMSSAYDPEYRRHALFVARERNIPVHEGVYAMVGGPSFETPAEIRFLRMIGADAVGMSTAYEVVVARHAQMRVLGISAISNVAVSTPGGGTTTHEEVLQAGAVIVPRLTAIIQDVIEMI